MQAEEERIRAAQKLEADKLKKRRSLGSTSELTSSFIEEGYHSDEADGAIGAIKARYKRDKTRKHARRERAEPEPEEQPDWCQQPEIDDCEQYRRRHPGHQVSHLHPRSLQSSQPVWHD